MLGRESHAKFAAALTLIGAMACAARSSADPPPQPIDFSRDVRPILANNCFQCHGPDGEHREADLRLDQWQDAGDIRGAAAMISAGKPDESALVARISSDDPDLQMPPVGSGKSLKPEQIEILRNWVAQGATYKQHWAFVTPERPAVPQVKDSSRVRNPIDAFVAARLEREQLEPAPPASQTTLRRRLSLDLVGLPPTLEEIAAFKADCASGDADGAYRREVERLLNSPHYGERWGRIWLDAARYADSNGFEKDRPRFVWMYRDWVINALNSDLRYDQFIIQQIAGDLLPEPTQDQLVATGFLCNSMINEEGGIDPEQFRMEAMFDRMNAIGKGILGLTIQCAQCHTHKYDPLEQADYYRMFAFLNNCHEAQISVYARPQKEEWATTESVIRRIEEGLREANPDWRERMAAWEESVRNDQPEWTIIRPHDDTTGDQKHYVLDDSSVLAAGAVPTKVTTEFSAESKLSKITAFRLELLNDPNLPHGGPGRSLYGTCALTEFMVEAAPLDKPEQSTALKFAKATADVNPRDDELEKIFDNQSGERRVTGPIEYAIDANHLTAWTIDIGGGRSNVPRKAVFALEKPLEMAHGARLKIKLAQEHGGWNSGDNQNNNLGCFRFSVTTDDNVAADPVPSEVRAILEVLAAERTPEQVDRLFSYWRTTVLAWAEENQRIEALWQSHPRGTTQLALVEREKKRMTHRLERGNFLAPAEKVSPGTPGFLHPLTTDGAPIASPSRLDFARWLADRRSPTTARSIVNRIWQSYFGTGLVLSAEDLGMQGEPPSHPELLDWLAVELMDHNWSLKHIHQLIVTSATYRQSSNISPELFGCDPTNRLLARGARFRVDAEVVRDIALAASGLLYGKVGGPSVYPPAPEFLFQPPASYGPKTWIIEAGPNRYRRALYTFCFRSVPYPMLQNFDAPIGQVSCARRTCSNTPLQALTTLNEPLFVECARALAVKVLTHGGTSDADRLRFAVRCCLSRDPQQTEIEVLQTFLAQQQERFGKEGANPWQLLIDDNKEKQKLASKLPTGVSPVDLAAWTAVARVVLNLDETITKE